VIANAQQKRQVHQAGTLPIPDRQVPIRKYAGITTKRSKCATCTRTTPGSSFVMDDTIIKGINIVRG